MPDNPSIHYISLLFFLLGFFLLLAGLGIFKIEKVTVSPGAKTWGLGLILIAISVFLFVKPALFEHKNSKGSPVAEVQKAEKIKPPLVPQIELKYSSDQEAKASLKSYYDLLNEGNIGNAWGFLSENIQLKLFNRMSQSPVESYKTWWENQVHSVEIVSLEYVEGYPTVTEAKLDAKLIYILDGRIKCSDDHSIIYLKKVGEKWSMFDKNRIAERSDTRNCL